MGWKFVARAYEADAYVPLVGLGAHEPVFVHVNGEDEDVYAIELFENNENPVFGTTSTGSNEYGRGRGHSI